MKKVLIILPFTFFLASCNKKVDSTNDLTFNLKLDQTYEVSLKKESKSEKIILPKTYNGINVTSINDFRANNYVKSVYIPSTITYFDNDVFNFCENLEEITVSKDNSEYSSNNGNLYTKKMDKLVKYAPGKKDINVSIKNIDSIMPYAFTYVTNLKTITLDVNIIEHNAFYYCQNLEEIYLNSNVTINEKALNNNTKLKNVYIIKDSTFKIDETNNLVNTNKTITKKSKTYLIYEVL